MGRFYKILFTKDLESIQQLSETFLNQLLQFWTNFDNEHSLLSPILFEEAHAIVMFSGYIIGYDAADTKRRELIEKNTTIKSKVLDHIRVFFS